ncbi:FHA domain-containing protein [Streptomyces sp. J15]|uniref:FHA domain-containing protein n=1 Tax=Streptomyces pakalii TaxID=3036494 RepID=A0ABT7DBY6_9ACTN|nr:FHA domain-containing protein [Streptomyces pakalii]MDJ1643327.1 FHA domain-containing protein [Streptomyces pakalii]
MQIRLTVLAPRSGQTPARSCDVLVTAPAGTALAAVASQLAAAVSGPESSQGGGAVVLFAGRDRLDGHRIALGEPPLVDGAVLSLQVPGDDEATDDAVPAQLHVVAGPDAGGVHLLHGGQIRIGRSADADVPLDDPDVSRLHCAVTVSDDGRVSVADLGSTNGTSLDGVEVRERPVRLAPGALLRLGESTLRLTSGSRPATLPTAPDGEGHLRVTRAETGAAAPGQGTGAPFSARTPDHGAQGPGHVYAAPATSFASSEVYGDPEPSPDEVSWPERAAAGPGAYGGDDAHALGEEAAAAPAPRRGIGAWARRLKGGAKGEPAAGPEAGSGAASGERADAYGSARPPAGPGARAAHGSSSYGTGAYDSGAQGSSPYGSEAYGSDAYGTGTYGSGARGSGGPGSGVRGSGGHDSGARGFGGPGGSGDPAGGPSGAGHLASPASPGSPFSALPSAPEGTWPDPAAVLLTALGPGPRLWERRPDHPEALVVRLGTTDRAEVPSVPVTVGLREAGSLGLAGPRARLAGLARATVAQLAALHSPFDLEIVLISTDRSRTLEERRREWSWLGWLPHLRPTHGQDCRLLLAYDREQAEVRAAELVRRLDEGPLGPGWPHLDRAAVAEAARAHAGPHTVVVLDGDPGTAFLRETTARLAGAGAAAGIHLICLAETPAASPTSPVAATYEAACRSSIAFRECGAVAMLSGDVATALRLLRTAGGQAAGHGTVAAVDAVSAAWAERFGRALAPLREEGSAALAGRPTTAALPPSARLLDELGLARATPASLMARWASTAEAQPGASVPRAAAAPPPRADLDSPNSGRTLSAGPRVGPQRTAASPHHDSDRTPYPAAGAPDPERTPYPPLEAHDSGRTPYPPLDSGDSGRTPYPSPDSRDSGRTPYPPLDARDSERTPFLGAQRSGSESGAETRERGVTTASTAGSGGAAPAHTGRPVLVLGAGPRGPLSVDLADEGPHLLIEGPPGSGRTELLRAVAASLASAARPDRLGILLVDGSGGDQGERGEGLLPCTELPHVFAHLVASDPVRMREFAQALGGELKRRAELLGELDFATWHERYGQQQAQQEAAPRVVGQRPPSGAERRGDLDSPASGTLRLRPAAARSADPGPSPLPRLVVLADDFDALVAPALGSPGRPAAGSVVRALEAVARDGGRLGVHLVATSARPDRTEDTELARGARLRIVLDAPVLPPSPDEPAPGRGRLGHPDGRVTPFQGGRVTGRIPRTATLRPTVVPLEWERMGDPPTRRPVRELGNGPTDLALLASALERAARSVNAERLPALVPFTT